MFLAPRLVRAQAQTDLDRFERQAELRQRETQLRIDQTVPLNQRALIDYGGFASFNYLSIDDEAHDNHILRQWDLVGYLRVNLDPANEIFLRGRVGYRDFNDQDSFDGFGDEIIDPDLERGFWRFDSARMNATSSREASQNNIIIKAGRELAYWGNGLVLSQTVDGVQGEFIRGGLGLGFVAGVTPTRTVDYDSSRPNFDHNTRRGFYGAMLTAHGSQHQPFIYGLLQRDYNEDDFSNQANTSTTYEYNTAYLGIGSTGTLTDRLNYGIEVVYEDGNNRSSSFTFVTNVDPDSGAVTRSFTPVDQTRDEVQALALDMRLDYIIPDARRSRLGAEIILASGDDDRIVHGSNTFGGNNPGTRDRAFNGFGLLDTGVAFSPDISNLAMLRIGGSMFPLPDVSRLRQLQVGTDLLVFAKLAENAPIDEPTTNDHYLGFEPDIYLNWQVTTDVTVAMRYGIFFPGTAVVQDENPRQYFSIGVTYAF